MFTVVSLSMILFGRGAHGYSMGLILDPADEALLDLPHGVLSGMGLHTPAGPVSVPSSLNWAEKKGKMNPVKNQGACGSCWAFAAADAQSARDAVKNGVLHDVSEKHMLDCTYPTRDGCRGGHSETAWMIVSKKGAAGQNFYRSYNRRDETCPSDSEFDRLKYKRVSWVGDAQNDPKVHKYFSNKHELKEDITKYGPCVMYMGVDSAFQRLRSDSGVWRCNPRVRLNHAITVIGWGQQNGENYWHIKNSWGTGWGNKGFAKVSMDHCNMGSSTGVMFLCPEIRRKNGGVPTPPPTPPPTPKPVVARCVCSGRVNSRGSGGADCKSKWCYTAIDACTDGRRSSMLKDQEYSYKACSDSLPAPTPRPVPTPRPTPRPVPTPRPTPPPTSSGACRCSGRVNSKGQGGADCKTTSWCYTNIGACKDGKSSSSFKDQEWSFEACRAGPSPAPSPTPRPSPRPSPTPKPVPTPAPSGYKMVPGSGWCMTADGKYETARYTMPYPTTLAKTKAACDRDSKCVAYVWGERYRVGMIYSTKGCSADCSNDSWQRNPKLISKAGLPYTRTYWADATCNVKN